MRWQYQHGGKGGYWWLLKGDDGTVYAMVHRADVGLDAQWVPVLIKERETHALNCQTDDPGVAREVVEELCRHLYPVGQAYHFLQAELRGREQADPYTALLHVLRTWGVIVPGAGRRYLEARDQAWKYTETLIIERNLLVSIIGAIEEEDSCSNSVRALCERARDALSGKGGD